MAGHTAIFSSADLGMKTEKAENITRRYEGGSARAHRPTTRVTLSAVVAAVRDPRKLQERLTN